MSTTTDFFPSPRIPRIYAYSDTRFPNCLKVGFTERTVVERMREHYPTVLPSNQTPYKVELDEVAVRNDGSLFKDHEVHKILKSKRYSEVTHEGGEWFNCSVEDIKAAVLELKTGVAQHGAHKRTQNFGLRPEQSAAIDKAIAYFKSAKTEDEGTTPHFLWNAKMRFGKTFTTYQLAKKLGWQKILILTFKPAVEDAWEEDLNNHVDFEGWQFISPRTELRIETADKNSPVVCFGSFQDYLGKNNAGGIKAKNERVHTTNWDCVVFDEYHYGAWRESAKELFADSGESAKASHAELGEVDYFDEGLMPITTGHYLYLSGTPFRAIASGEFIEEQIFNWTYSDEQRAKTTWDDAKGSNPYAALPRMVMLTYQLPPHIRDVALKGEFDEFDLNEFFKASGEDLQAKFKYEEAVQKWLDLIRGNLMETTVDNLKLGAEKPPMPFADVRLLQALNHTFWFLPTVAACQAMRNLLAQKNNTFYHDYRVIVAAGSSAGIGVEALPPVLNTMNADKSRGLNTKSITLSCGKLTTGVSVAPWTGIFMLRNSSSPETYFQAAFRVQTPWVVRGLDANDPNQMLIVKNECYVFDFAPDRALRQVAEYSCRLNINESNPEANVAEFIQFLPVLAYDGSSMKQIDAAGILDMAMSGTTATLLARRWESALLVNVDNGTLKKLMENEAAMKALMSIEGFRNLNQDIETIINKSDAVKKGKEKANDGDLTTSEKKKLTDEEKELNSARKQIQEKLIKFATRIPVFMYLSDYRERSLKDVITQLEPDLFKKVTGLGLQDFALLESLGVFNGALMNDAVYKFKRYEDASLNYTGISGVRSDEVGLWSTVINKADFV